MFKKKKYKRSEWMESLLAAEVMFNEIVESENEAGENPLQWVALETVGILRGFYDDVEGAKDYVSYRLNVLEKLNE